MLESMRGLEFHEAMLSGHHPPDTLPNGITFKQCRPTDLRSNKALPFLPRLRDFLARTFAR